VGPEGRGPGRASSQEGSLLTVPLPCREGQTELQKRGHRTGFLPRTERGCFVLLNLFKLGWSPRGENGSSVFIKSTINTLPL